LERFGCPAVSLSEPFEDGLALLRVAEKRGLEGVVSKAEGRVPGLAQGQDGRVARGEPGTMAAVRELIFLGQLNLIGYGDASTLRRASRCFCSRSIMTQRHLGTSLIGAGKRPLIPEKLAEMLHLRELQSRASSGPEQLQQGARSGTYSITSSARSKIDCGIVRLSALAVFRLIASLNLIGCTTGKSPGRVPLRTRPV